MPKYGVTTYGMRKRSKDASSQLKFDLVKDERTDCSNDDSSERTENSVLNRNGKREDSILPTIKRRKVVPLYEDDLFGFTENDSNTVVSQNKLSGQKNKISNSKARFEYSTDGTDRSTDDEAYCSSQEPNGFSQESRGSGNEKPTQRQSPFKHFLKNNVTSLSPKKNKTYDRRRFSALPTNIGTSDEDLSDSNSKTLPSLSSTSSRPETQSSLSSTVRVKREEKQLFTVVRNVKHKHACLEDGETQQFFDDVDFALDGLRKDLSLAARCSSALDLAAQCSTPSFRVNLRAHGIISKIFDALQDAPSNKTLALCASCVFYVITRDRLNVDFNYAILELLLKLLCVSESGTTGKVEKKSVHEEMIRKARQILTRLPDSFTSYLDMENLSSVSLARESLLSLTSQRTGEWFKEEIRTLGGLDYIVNIVSTSVENIKNSDELLQNEKGVENIERCLKLIENVTFQNRENQLYLVSCKKSSLIMGLARLMKVCIHGIVDDQLAALCLFFKTVLDCLKSILKVFLNLTHDNDGESETIGQQDGLISALLLCVLQVPQFVAVDEQFDILVLALGLLINLMEHSKQNIASLIVLKTPLSYETQEDCQRCKNNIPVPSVEALVHLFLIRKEAARNNENMACKLSSDNDELKPTKDGLGWVCGEDIDVSREEDEEEEDDLDKSMKKSSEQESQEDEIGDALQKAGKHMEDSMVASYVALLLGCIAQDNKANQNLIRQLLPENSFEELINTLKTFLGFMKLTSGTTGQAIERIIDVLKAC